MSKEFLPETTTVTITQQHFNGETFISTSVITGLELSDLVRAVRLAAIGMEFSESSVNKAFPKCES